MESTTVSSVEIGQVLAELRNERDICQKEVAAYLNVSIGTISNYENGVHYPDLLTLCKLANFYGVSTDYLLRRTNYRYTSEAMNRPLAKDYTVAQLVNTALELSQKDRGLLADYTGLLKLRQTVNASRAAEKET